MGDDQGDTFSTAEIRSREVAQCWIITSLGFLSLGEGDLLSPSHVWLVEVLDLVSDRKQDIPIPNVLSKGVLPIDQAVSHSRFLRHRKC